VEAELGAARFSAEQLRTVVASLDDDALIGPSNAIGWSIADVLSHLGSMAVIIRRQIDDVLAGALTPDGFRQQVWDDWNAKSPRRKASDSLIEDTSVLDRFDSLTEEECSRFSLDLGPLTVDAALLLALRVGEHGMHTWDIAVALDPSATLPPQVAAVTVDNARPLAPLIGKSSGDDRQFVIHTTNPARHFVIDLKAGSVALNVGSETDDADLRLSTEGFARLLFGRAGPQHTPAFEGEAKVFQDLCRVFAGF